MLKIENAVRGKRINELEGDAARMRRQLRERCEYVSFRENGGRDRGGSERDHESRWRPRLGHGTQRTLPRERTVVAHRGVGCGAREALEDRRVSQARDTAVAT